jgi:L-amino acid N-acyltransferase YncA
MIVYIRRAVPEDAVQLRDILNHIIKTGGMTAMETPLTVAAFSRYFLTGPDYLDCRVAEDGANGTLLGFQSLGRHLDLPIGWADIATFTRRTPRTPRVGTALFAQTKAVAQQLGLTAINAAIRADNPGGLAYYEKLGFQTYDMVKGGTQPGARGVGRILKRYLVNQTEYAGSPSKVD